MNKAEMITEELLKSLSPALLDVVNVRFGTVTEVSIPTTPDDAALTNGIVNANFNNAILVPLSGVPIVELVLKNAVLNEVLKGILLSSVELRAGGDGRIVMITPSDGGIYYGGLINIKVQVTDAVSVEATTDTETLTLFQDGEHEQIWAADYTLTEEGIHTIEVSAVFADDSTDTESATFDIRFWEHSPKEGDIVDVGTVEITLSGDNTDITSVSVAGVAASAIDLVYDAAAGLWKGIFEASETTYEAVYTVVFGGHVVQKTVYFSGGAGASGGW